MKRIVLALGFSISLAPALAHADQLFTFQSVDAAKRMNTALEITGILAGESTPTTAAMKFSSSQEASSAEFLTSCYQSAVIAMNRPGRFQLEITRADWGGAIHCALRRNQ